MRITVVGDVLLDEDVTGTSTRMSPDAPVPVIDVTARAVRAGGAGLVATMLAGEGHEVVLVTALSDDPAAETLRGCLKGVSIVAGRSGAPTPVKTRLRCNDEPFGRIDVGCAPAPAPEVTAAMRDAVGDADAVIVADYGRGLTADDRLRAALARRAEDVPLVWDPHPRGARPVPGTWLVTPNAAEAAAAVAAHDGDDPQRVAEALRERWGCRAVVVTLGDDGAALVRGGLPALHVPVDAVDHADPCGAGDRFAAAALVSLARTQDAAQAVHDAVAAARDYLAAGGVSALRPPAAVPRASATAEDPAPTATAAAGAGDAAAVIAAARARGGTIVATGGCFDLIHAGHVRTLQAARAMGDCLIVCLNSDASVRRLKGPERPLIDEHDRTELLTALACVDAVVVFDEDTPEAVLSRLRPDVWVKGGDYSAAALPETALLRTWGGQTVTLPYHLGRSTTALAAKLADVI